MKTITLNEENLVRIVKLAGPFIDDVNIVVKGLLNHWDRTHEESKPSDRLKTSPLASAGDMYEGLPVKLELRATYRHRMFHAVVESGGIRLQEDGQLYSALSAAAIALKRSVFGKDENSASTNGWTFWQYWDEATKQWEYVDRLRQHGHKT